MNARTIDFLRPRRTPLLGWLLLVAGSLAVGIAVRQEQHFDAAQALRDDAEARFEHDETIARERSEAAAKPTPESRRLDAAELEVRRPWLATLEAVEAATSAPVYVLDFTVQPSKGLVHLEGESPDFDQAVAYVERLRSEGALSHASLASHESVTDAATARQLVRFSVNAIWGRER